MQPSIGEFIRQARRQQNFTQTQLGGTHFSKSYVSAVERNKISSSPEALRFFAEQLGQPSDYFTSLLQQFDNKGQLSAFNAPGSPTTFSPSLPDETLTLLDILLENTELYNFSPHYELPALSPEVIGVLPLHKQARYYFLMGLIARNKHDNSTALKAFEYALALALDKHRPAILDELGASYYNLQAYQTALCYHQRALNLLQQESYNEANDGLRFKVELHCGDDYRALGAYHQALEHYEQARQYLSSEQDLKRAGLLYIGLGYCTYTVIHQQTALINPNEKERATFEEMERTFQRAISFLLQGRSVYQVSGDRAGEVSALLTLAMVLLDFSIRQRQMVQDKSRAMGRQTSANCTSLLNDAEAQCRQVLLGWQEAGSKADIFHELDVTNLYVALSCLIRIAVQRAVLARLDGYVDTASRERVIASYLCQRVLDSVSENSLPWTVIRYALAPQSDGLAYSSPSLPRLPDLADADEVILRSSLDQVEVYFAAGEVAEELGRAATSLEYSHDCYARATQCFQAALKVACSMKEHDPSYLARCYQRCACILEERITAAPELADETIRIFLSILKAELWQMQYPVLDKILQALPH